MLDFSVTFIITVINITVLYLVLRAILFKPVSKFMAGRSRQIKDSIEQAEKDRAEAKALLARYETQLDAAKTEADTIIRSAREAARQEADRIAGEGRVAAENALRNARKQIEAEQLAALSQFKKEAASLVISASERLLGRELGNDDNRNYARMLLNESTALEPGSGNIN